MIEIAAFVACLVLSGLTVFQIALVLGAPIGHFAWGGAHRVLPGKLRVGSVIAVLLYAVFAVFILDKAGLVDVIADDSVTAVGMWVITGYFTLGILMNGISRSKLERAVMTPTAFVLALSSLVVALN
jgi:hypothetical protein